MDKIEITKGQLLEYFLDYDFNKDRLGIDEIGLYIDKIFDKYEKSLNIRNNRKCRFCINPDSILSEDTCCTGCSMLNKVSH